MVKCKTRINVPCWENTFPEARSIPDPVVKPSAKIHQRPKANAMVFFSGKMVG
jgi:hypothetical protein